MGNEIAMRPEKVEAEKLAYWYFRLNGFLTIPNFVVHDEWEEQQRTEVDILGVRFPYRAELLVNSMCDDEVLTKIKDKPYIIIAEVKKGRCKLNGPWTNPKEKNMDRVLRAIGAFADDTVSEVAQRLYEDGFYENKLCYLSLFCVGKKKNSYWLKKLPNVPQKLWDDILKFIYNRFKKYEEQKASHKQWDETGHQLWDIFKRCGEQSQFVNKIEIVDKITLDSEAELAKAR